MARGSRFSRSCAWAATAALCVGGALLPPLALAAEARGAECGEDKADVCADNGNDNEAELLQLQLLQRRQLQEGSVDGRRSHSDGMKTSAGPIRWGKDKRYCIDVSGGSTHNGANIQMWTCVDGSPNQQFIWDASERKIRWAAHTSKCIDVKDSKDASGTNIQLWDCSDKSTAQGFDIIGDRSSSGPIKWTSHPSMCLDVDHGGGWAGANVHLWKCGTQPSIDFYYFGAAPMPTPPPTPPKSYDFVIVGGGLSGSVVAAGLAERLPHKSILLMEAGKPSQRVLNGSTPPATWQRNGWASWQPTIADGLTRYDVPLNYEVLNSCWSPGCNEVSWAEVPVYQCKLLGGCGELNGALSQHPVKSNFDTWPAGWKQKDLEKYFQKVEHEFTLTQTPSADGKHYLDKETGVSYFVKAMGLQGIKPGKPLVMEANAIGYPFVTARDGVRESTAARLLPRAVTRPNFELLTDAEVTSITHTDGRATRVSYRQGGVTKDILIKASGQVVLTAGVFNTVRLLLGSNLGHPAVIGKGISDHALHYLTYDLPSNSGVTGYSFEPSPPSSWTNLYNSQRIGPLTQYGPTYVAYFKDPSTAGDPSFPDVEAFLSRGAPNTLKFGLALMRPNCSSADIVIEGPDNKAVWKDFRLYEACQRDKDTIQWAKNFLDKAMAKVGARNSRLTEPPYGLNHYASACRLGNCADPSTLIVRGTKNVAVADASIFPTSVWGHPQMTTAAVAYKAVDLLAK